MYKVRDETTPEAIKHALIFSRIDNFKPEQLSKIEIWGSSFLDPGPDWCEYALFDLEGREIFRKRVPGY